MLPTSSEETLLGYAPSYVVRGPKRRGGSMDSFLSRSVWRSGTVVACRGLPALKLPVNPRNARAEGQHTQHLHLWNWTRTCSEPVHGFFVVPERRKVVDW